MKNGNFLFYLWEFNHVMLFPDWKQIILKRFPRWSCNNLPVSNGSHNQQPHFHNYYYFFLIGWLSHHHKTIKSKTFFHLLCAKFFQDMADHGSSQHPTFCWSQCLIQFVFIPLSIFLNLSRRWLATSLQFYKKKSLTNVKLKIVTSLK